MRSARSVSFLAIAAICVSCDQNTPGSFNLTFVWPEGGKPDFAKVSLYAWAKLQRWPGGDPAAASTLSEAGPARLGDTAQRLQFGDLTYGGERVVMVEVRSTEERSDRVLFFGKSEAFEVRPGENSAIPVDIELRPTPGTSVMGESRPPEVSILYSGKKTNQLLPSEKIVGVTVVVDNFAGGSISLANASALLFNTKDSSETVVNVYPSKGPTFNYDSWDLNLGLSGELFNTNSRTVFAQARGEYGYVSGVGNATVVMDNVGPAVVGSSLVREPAFFPAIDSANKAVHFSATDPYSEVPTRAILIVYADEEIQGDPTLNATGLKSQSQLAFTLGDVQEKAAKFQYELDGDEAEDTYEFEIVWKDKFGTQAKRDIFDDKMVISNTLPDESDVDFNLVSYTRTPWGSQNTGPRPTQAIRGSRGTVRPRDQNQIVSMIAYTDAGVFLGSSDVRTDGSFEIQNLTGDLPVIRLSAVGLAGVKTSLMKIRNVEWVATMGYKVAGSMVENPNAFRTTGIFESFLTQNPDFDHEPAATDMGRLTRTDTDTMLRTGGPRWLHLNQNATRPSSRECHAMVYDSVRGKVVLFGGMYGYLEYFNDTWEWDGATGIWTERTPAGVKPSAGCEQHALAYDEARGKVVLFDGFDTQDTWEWDGATGIWTKRTPAGVKPSARASHAMAYDSARGRVLLFGGYDSDADSCMQDLWEWDGAAGTWTDRTPAGTKPTARARHSLTFDAARGRVVLFGGEGCGSAILQDTWEWDGMAGTWTERAPEGTVPAARSGHAIAYDRERQRVILFGGADSSDFKFQTMWEWDGAAGKWTERTPAGARPAARDSHGLVYDNARDRVVLFGGCLKERCSMYGDDTWEWDGTTGTWTERTPAEKKPAPRAGHGLAYDSGRARVVLFGGFNGDGTGNRFEDTWEWDGAAGIWTERAPTGTKPAARTLHAVVYDNARGRTLLFGGHDGSSYLQDTWEWDGAMGAWTERTPVGTKPAERGDHAMAYDVARGRVVLFGGSASSYLQDTWEWDGANGTWTERTTAGATPRRRDRHSVTYDNARERVLLFGGVGDAGFGLPDTWEWDGAAGSWTERTPLGTGPMARSNHAMTYDSGRGCAVLLGGDLGMSDEVQDTWEWDGALAIWTERSPEGTKPTARSAHAMAYDSGRERIVMFGGFFWDSSSHYVQDTWEWDGGARMRAGQMMKANFGAAGLSPEGDPNILQSVTVDFYSGAVGYPYGLATNGVDLKVWDEGMWKTVASNTSGPDNPTKLEWSTDADPYWSNLKASDPAGFQNNIRRLFFGDQQTLNFAVTPTAPNGTGTGVIATDYVEVRVKYKLP